MKLFEDSFHEVLHDREQYRARDAILNWMIAKLNCDGSSMIDIIHNKIMKRARAGHIPGITRSASHNNTVIHTIK
jgi:hypothetical protein